MDFSIEYAVSILEVILINVALSGDNAVVIAMAARRLPGRQRRRAVFWGGGLAIAMQAAFTLVVARLLALPGLRLLGGMLLAGIAFRLVQEESESSAEAGGGDEAGPACRGPILRIALANLAMSFDNVVAVAGISRSDPVRMALGLVVSGLILFACSAGIAELMTRFRWIVYAGAAVLAVTASGMIWHDLAAAWSRSAMATWDLGLGATAGLEARALFTAMVVAGCLVLPRWARRLAARIADLARIAGEWAVAPFRRPGLSPADQAAD